MAADPTLVAQPRPRTGSAENRRLRGRHVIPGIVYGHKEGSVPIAVPEQDLQPILHSGHQVVDLQSGGTTQKAIFKEVQYDTFGIQVLHFDLMRVSADELVEVEVSIEFHGTKPPGRRPAVCSNRCSTPSKSSARPCRSRTGSR